MVFANDPRDREDIVAAERHTKKLLTDLKKEVGNDLARYFAIVGHISTSLITSTPLAIADSVKTDKSLEAAKGWLEICFHTAQMALAHQKSKVTFDFRVKRRAL